MIYTHVLKLGGGAVRSPLDALNAAALENEPDRQRQSAEPPPTARMPLAAYEALSFVPCHRSPATPNSTAAATSRS
jgi:hypothetical protein